MKTVWLIIFFISLVASGCQKGACYYSCCNSDGDCTVECQFKTNSASKCAVLAQETCEQSDYPNLARVEWKELNELICDSCSSMACAPSWWTEDRISEENMPDSGAEMDTDND